MTDCRFVTANIPHPILVSPLVSETLVRLEQPKNVVLAIINDYIKKIIMLIDCVKFLQINVNVEGIVTVVTPVLANIASPTRFKPLVRVTAVSEDDLNARSPMKLIYY